MLNGMIVEPVDNVVVAIEPVKKGETVTYMCAGEEKRLTAAEDITIYHKLAACDIAKGQPIVKYGEHIGLAARDIKAGEHVHCHNLEEHRENLDNKGGEGGYKYEFLRLQASGRPRGRPQQGPDPACQCLRL